MKNKKHCISKKGKESYCYINILKKDESIVNFFLGVFFDFLRIYICEMSKKKKKNKKQRERDHYISEKVKAS